MPVREGKRYYRAVVCIYDIPSRIPCNQATPRTYPCIVLYAATYTRKKIKSLRPLRRSALYLFMETMKESFHENQNIGIVYVFDY